MGILGIYASAISANTVNTAGTTWTAKTLPSSGSWWSPVLGGASNNIWMISKGTGIATSTDNGTTWTARTKNLSGISLAYGAGVWVSVDGNTGSAEYSSNDGVSWTTVSMPANNNWDSLIYADGRFFAVAYGSNTCATSTDGISWGGITMPTQTNARRTSVSYSTGLDMWVTTSRDSSFFDSSPDGVTWTARTAPSSGNWYGSAGNSTVYVANIDSSTTYATSTNGTSWTGRTFGATQGSVMGLESKFGTLLMMGSSPTSNVYTSTDGTTWTTRSLPSSASWLAPSKILQTNSNVMMVAIYGGSTIAVALQ